ncbi:MAG: hypothetical protein ACLVH9_05890 [Fusobacterium sp.]|uniref:hypothetical protein n=1 Tax=Fusobacterium sp. TaxID=68766 RepID=UPI00399A6F01
MDENKFKYNGVELKSEEIPKHDKNCEKCYFCNVDCELLYDKKLIPDCMEFARKDKRDVIFVEIENRTQEEL